MNKTFLSLSLGALVCLSSYVEAFVTCVVPPKSHNEIGIVFRADQLKWILHDELKTLVPFVVGSGSSSSHSNSSSSSDSQSISSSEGIEESLIADSNIKMHPLSSVLLRIESKHYFCPCFFTKVFGDIGWLYEGRSRERDYFVALSKPGPYVAKNTIRGGIVGDISGAVGHHFTLIQQRLQIGVLAGYAANMQIVRANGRRKIQTQLTASEQSDIGFTKGGGRNKFSSYWYGPWLGMDVNYHQCEGWNLYSEFEYHFPRSSRTRHTFTPLGKLAHEHKGVWGQGINLKIGARYYFCPDAFINGNWFFSHWRANQHDDHFEWRTVGIEINFGYDY